MRLLIVLTLICFVALCWSAQAAPWLQLSGNAGDSLDRTAYSKGFVVCGSPGSGKTSSAVLGILAGAVRNNITLYLPCNKHDDADHYQRFLEAEGQRFIRIRPGGKWKCSLLHQLYTTQPSTNVKAVLLSLMQQAGRQGGGGSKEPFWEVSAVRYLNNFGQVLRHARRPVTPVSVQQFVSALPQTVAESKADKFKASEACRLQTAAFESDSFEAQQAVAFTMREFPATPDKTRGSILAYVSNILDDMAASPVREIFFSNETNYTAAECIKNRIHVIVDFPILSLGAAATYAQTLHAEMFAAQALKGCPGLLFVLDEAHLHLTESWVRYTSTGRSQGLWTLIAFQSIPVLEAGLSGGPKGAQMAAAIMSNLGTHVYMAGNCPRTNEFASSLVGKAPRRFRSTGYSSPHEHDGCRGSSFSAGTSEHMEWILPPTTFNSMSPGQAVVIQTGKVWSNRRTYLKTFFPLMRR